MLRQKNEYLISCIVIREAHFRSFTFTIYWEIVSKLEIQLWVAKSQTWLSDYRSAATKGVVKAAKSKNKKEYEESPRAATTESPEPGALQQEKLP